jgi:hypothetical protein
MTILLSDPRVAAVPVAECREPLVVLGPDFGPARALVRAGLAVRLARARAALPPGIGLRVGDRYWALAAGVPAALYRPVAGAEVAA